MTEVLPSYRMRGCVSRIELQMAVSRLDRLNLTFPWLQILVSILFQLRILKAPGVSIRAMGAALIGDRLSLNTFIGRDECEVLRAVGGHFTHLLVR